ncbi:MAG TPA: aldose epimerase family protein [Polyangia bacterium]|nr:aldose epimerase family protein [Polyangia bacterium]
MSSAAGDLHTLTNARGATALISPFGATVVELRVPDRAGALGNVVLGLDDPAAYARQNFFLGALCGRVCNRIRDARFTLGGVTYGLEANDPPHHLHGGSHGWYRARWTPAPTEAARPGAALTLTHHSPEGDAGYPGAVAARVTYTLTDDGALRIEMSATTDQPTPINLTHHGYWNLAGGGTVLDHLLTVAADAYTPGDPVVPTGAVEPVAGTALDYRSPRRVGPELDHNFVVAGAAGTMRRVARLHDPRSGRVMTVESDQPGLQVYAGKFLDGSTAGRGAVHGRHAGICLETQAFPDAVNVPAWRGQVLLHPGDTYRHTVVYAFATDGA